MMDINELIAAIRAWQAANDEYLAALVESPEYGTRKRIGALLDLDAASQAVIGWNHDDAALAASVALVDEVERLKKQVKRLSKTADLDEGYIEFLERKEHE